MPQGRRHDPCQPGASPRVATHTNSRSAEGAAHHGRRNGTDARMIFLSACWTGLSALDGFCGLLPRALPWAGMRRAVGAGDDGRNAAGEFVDEGGEEVRGGRAGDRAIVLQEGPHRRIRSASVFQTVSPRGSGAAWVCSTCCCWMTSEEWCPRQDLNLYDVTH